MALLFVIVITVLCCEIDCLTQSVKETRDDIGVIGHVALVALSVTPGRGGGGGTPTNCHTGVCRSIGSILNGQFP